MTPECLREPAGRRPKARPRGRNIICRLAECGTFGTDRAGRLIRGVAAGAGQAALRARWSETRKGDIPASAVLDATAGPAAATGLFR
ncbi:hypothetical protein ACFH04_02505 [Streptomyces noboritoensis]|uniref:Uncharacterized protein n=1 Tax=Streptomyces noboritoensis TaxID=67337 RepID=A0ABV6T9Y9_9ACTN